MPEAEVEPLQLALTVQSRPTEMGFEVRIHSTAVNITVELDLDADPEFFYGVCQTLPEIVSHQMEQCVNRKESDDSDV